MEKYEKGKYYDGLGKYLGIINLYPYGVDYVIKEHRFIEIPVNNRVCGKTNTIEIERIDK